MPFDLVIDEHTADGQEARVSKTSVAGSWGAVAGTLRFFADRFGVPERRSRAPRSPTTWFAQHASLGPPTVVLTGPRKHQRLAVERRLDLLRLRPRDRGRAAAGPDPRGAAPAARDVLAEALLAGETVHPDRAGSRRALAQLDERWRRSGGTLRLDPEALRVRVRAQLDQVMGWDEFFSTRLALDPSLLVDETTRGRLEALPAMVRLRGDAAPLDYEVEDGKGVARVRLREGQAKRAFATVIFHRSTGRSGSRVQRGRHEPILAQSLADLQYRAAAGAESTSARGGWGSVPAGLPRAERSPAARLGGGLTAPAGVADDDPLCTPPPGGRQ